MKVLAIKLAYHVSRTFYIHFFQMVTMKELLTKANNFQNKANSESNYHSPTIMTALMVGYVTNVADSQQAVNNVSIPFHTV